jgi:hypothetical protein
MEWMQEGGRVRLITCKAYSGVSSEAMGPNDGSIWLVVHSRVRTDIGRGTAWADDRSQPVPFQMEGTRAVIRTRKAP